MSRWVRNRLTGLVHDVPSDHWSLGSDDYEEVRYGAPPRSPRVTGPLPGDFPARAALAAHGFSTLQSLEGLTVAALQRLKGIGPARARAIVTARDRS